jgi:phage terminase large subunit
MSDILLDNPVRFIPPDGTDGEWPPVDEWSDAHWRRWLQEHNKYPFLKQWADRDITQYLEHDRYFYGISFKRHKNEPPWWFYMPTPVAVPFHAAKVPNILFGGAVGGSKSHSARHDAYRHALAVPEYNGIIMRRTFEELERNHLEKALREISKINTYFQDERFGSDGLEAADYVSTKHRIRVKVHGPGKDSTILFGHCQNLGDEEKYLGDAYDGFYPDEMATFIRKQIVGVAGRLRSEKRIRGKKLIPRLGGTSNPGGSQTLWLSDYYINKLTDKIREENPKYKPDEYLYIQAMLYDNPYYMDSDGTYDTYEARLYEYDSDRRRQLLLGDWTALAGQFFPEFSHTIHVKRLHIPEGSKIELWLDWGYDPHYGMALWAAILPSGRIYVFFEYKFNGQHAKQKLVAAEVAKNIKRLTHEHVLPLVKTRRLSKSIADPAMWGKEGQTGEDYAETFARFGVPITKADNSRELGWGRLRHWFRMAPDGDPWLVIDPDCVTTIRTIPGLVRDKHNPDDVDTSGEDHPADTLRYGVMAHPQPKRMRESTLVVPDSALDVLRSLISEQPRNAGMVR